MSSSSKAGCHYFFGSSPLNFWSNLDHQSIVDGVSKVRSLGFDSLFLLVPWAEFVDDRDGKVEIQGYCSEHYRLIVSECRRAKLGLHVRVAYLWEAGPAGSTSFQRYYNFFSDPIHARSLEALCRFLRTVEREVDWKTHYFFSWEEPYWPIFSHWRSRPLEERVVLAKETGYKTFLELQGIATNEATAIPVSSEPDLMNFCQFYDSVILSKFVRILKSGLDEIGMEYRVDSDLVMHTKGYDEYYHWPLCHPGVTQKYIYYHPQLFGHFTESLTAEQANDRLKWVIHTAAPRLNMGERPVIVDQFNFIDDTEADWITIDDEQLNKFLALASQEIRARKAKIVLWSTIDWPRDVIFNGSFKLGMKGWSHSGGEPSFRKYPTRGLILVPGMAIDQRPVLSFPTEKGFYVEITYDLIDSEATIEISTYSEKVDCKIDQQKHGKSIVKLTAYGGGVSIKATIGKIVITSVKMYDRYYSQGGDRSDGERTRSFSHFLENFNDCQ